MSSRPGDDMLQLVLDDETVDRIRAVAIARGLEVELVIVRLLQAASWRADELLDDQPIDIRPARWSRRRS